MIGSCLVAFLITQKAVPFMMDDLWYSTRLYDETPISNLSDILDAQIWHYLNWGGRSVTHTILQGTLLLGPTVADYLNTVVFCLLCLLILRLANQKGAAFYLCGMSLLIGCNANWMMSMFWQAGAANYLYMTVLLLYFLGLYLRWEPHQISRTKSIVATVGMVPIGLLAGWSNENMGPSLWVTSLVIMFIHMKKKNQIPGWMVSGNITCFIGSAFLILAPGNFVRLSYVPEAQKGILWRMLLQVYAAATAAFSFLFPVLLLLLCLIVYAKGRLGIRLGKTNVLLLLCAFLSWGSMALSPHYPDRATFGTMVLVICVILSLMGKMIATQKITRPWLFALTSVLWLKSIYMLGEYMVTVWGWII
jgi:hypothetical protein